MAMYQDRIFAFTPKGELIQLPKGATPVDFAYAVHTDLGDQTVGAKINGRRRAAAHPARQWRPGRDPDVGQGQTPQPAWLGFAVTGKARAAIRRRVRSKERDETSPLGPQDLSTRSSHRLPAKVGDKAIARRPASG